jgi:hypothetical protein
MGFEPLRTDEKLETPVRTRDLDQEMLSGCGSFVVAAFVTYLLTAWPWFVFSDGHRLASLAIACGLGMIPALLFGAFAARRGGLAGGCGFVAGSMAAAVFVYLRMEQLLLGRAVRELPFPEYPSAFLWQVPLGWLAAAILVTALALSRTRL